MLKTQVGGTIARKESPVEGDYLDGDCTDRRLPAPRVSMWSTNGVAAYVESHAELARASWKHEGRYVQARSHELLTAVVDLHVRPKISVDSRAYTVVRSQVQMRDLLKGKK